MGCGCSSSGGEGADNVDLKESNNEQDKTHDDNENMQEHNYDDDEQEDNRNINRRRSRAVRQNQAGQFLSETTDSASNNNKRN